MATVAPSRSSSAPPGRDAVAVLHAVSVRTAPNTARRERNGMAISYGMVRRYIVGITKSAPSFTPLGQRLVTVLVRV